MQLLVEMILILKEMAYYLRNKEIFNELLNERAHECDNLKDKTDPNEFVYNCKTEGNSPKGFREYRKPLELFENLRDGDVNSRELLNNQINCNSDLNEKKRKSKKFIFICSLKLNTKQKRTQNINS